MKFESIYEDWKDKKLTQIEAARLLDVSDRTFRRYIDQYEDMGVAGLMDRRTENVSPLAWILWIITSRYLLSVSIKSLNPFKNVLSRDDNALFSNVLTKESSGVCSVIGRSDCACELSRRRHRRRLWD